MWPDPNVYRDEITHEEFVCRFDTDDIKYDVADAQVTLTGADNAALGNFTIKVTSHPANGDDASNELKLTVAQK